MSTPCKDWLPAYSMEEKHATDEDFCQNENDRDYARAELEE